MKMPKLTSFSMLTLIMLVTFVAGYAFADDTVTSPADFLGQVIQFLQGAGALPLLAKVSGVVLLVVASMKVSFLKPTWDKLGAAKAWVAPILGLLAGILGLGGAGNQITLASVMAYVAAGGGAVLLHELLDTVKAIPGLGQIYIVIINMIEAIPVLGSGGVAKSQTLPKV